MADDKNKTAGDGPQTGAAASAVSGGVRADAVSSVESEPKQSRKVKFAPEQKSPTLEIGHGEYARKFDVKDSPFACADEEEFRLLIGTGFFVEA